MNVGLKKYKIKEILSERQNSMVMKKIQENLLGVLLHLGLDRETAEHEVSEIVGICKESSNIENIERKLRTKLIKLGLHSMVKEKLSDRAEKIYMQIKDYLAGNDILDLGCGDGKVGEAIHKTGKFVTLVDCFDYNESSLEVDFFDGLDLPYKDESYDTVLLLTVLHHCDHPIKILDEAIRIAKKRIIIIESVYFDEEHKKLNTFLDWFYNRVLHEGVNVPYNFRTPLGWTKLLEERGLKIAESIDLGIDQPTVPEYHWLFVVDKVNK